MVNAVKISNSLLGIVGWKQPSNPQYAILDEANQVSASGYFVNDSPYAKIEFIKSNQDYLDISNLNFNIFLRDMQKTQIANVCNQVFSDFDFLDRNLLFRNASNKVETDDLPTGFVGYEIQVTAEKNIAFKINRILADFEGTGDIKLLLWNTAKKAAIKDKTVTIVSDHQEIVLDWAVDNSDSTYKGKYFIGYINDDLTVKPYSRNYDNGNVMTDFKNLCIEKVFVAGHTDETLFDLRLKSGLSLDTGLNLDITVYEDFTDLVINNKTLFAKAINTAMILQCLVMYLASLRSNRNQKISEDLYDKILAEVDGTSADSVIKVKGLKPQLMGEISQIKKEIQKLKKSFFKSGQIFTSTLS